MTVEQSDLDRAGAHMLEAMHSLNQIGRAINHLCSDANVLAALHMIVDCAVQTMPGLSAAIHDCTATRCASAGAPGGEPAARFSLSTADQPVGTFDVYLAQPRSFNRFELLILENLANQATTAIYQASYLDARDRYNREHHDRHDLAHKEDEINRLRRAGLLISSRARLEETLEAILQMALEVINAHYGIFRLVDKEGHHLLTRAIAGERLGQPLVEALPIDERSVMGWVAVHRQPVCIADLHDEPWSGIYYPLDTGLEMRSELAVPLIAASGRLEGVLNLESQTVGAFDESDSHLLQALATQAVIAIQEVRLLDALQEVAQQLLVQPCGQVLAHLAELACNLLNAAASAIWTLQGDELVLQAASAGYQHGEHIPLHDSLTGQAILTRAPVRTDDLRTDPRFHRPDLAQAQEWSRALIVPLLASQEPAAQEVVGAFSVYSIVSEPGHFAESEWDEKVLTCLAHYAALAVRNAAHQEALRAVQEKHAIAETFAAVGDIAANVLHHLNNKVGTIPVRVQGIQDKCQTAIAADPYLAANLAEIERSAREAMDAVRGNLSRLRPIHLAPVDIATCVRMAVHTTGLPAGVDVQLKNLDDLPPVVAGQDSLTLVFANLMENAATAMNSNGNLSIQGQAFNEWVEVRVSDNGPGIVPDLHDRIFEFNFSGRKSKGTGKLGFGLWWVKNLMVRLGGAVVVESDGCHGTTFRLRLPRA